MAQADFQSLYGSNAVFIEELYQQYKQNPASVDASWREIFAQFSGEEKQVNWIKPKNKIIGQPDPEALPKPANKNEPKTVMDSAAADSIRALQLIRAYRENGHYAANLDPLGLTPAHPGPELEPATYGFTNADLDRQIHLNGQLGLDTASLREIIGTLQYIYSRDVGFEYGHIQNIEERNWLRDAIEITRGQPELTTEDKKWLLESLIEVDGFEQFIHVKFVGTKRFSLEGGDAMVPALKQIIKTSAANGVDEVIFGMPHRGRLNVLTAVMGKPYAAMLSEFHGNMNMPEGITSSGDVKYHMGYSNDVDINGKKIHLSLTANPSHLEAVNPVVCGKVRAKQDRKGDTDRSQVLGVLLHGDAAFAGQGSVAENLMLSDLDGYRTGGTAHIIVNNQIGFTTNPNKSRSSPYSSDVAKMIEAPIFHVNGDNPEAVLYVSDLAAQFRAKFKKDVVIDIVCYRRYGHNEGDEPLFTQPIMYHKISGLPRPREVYANKLIAEGTIDAAFNEASIQKFRDFLEGEFKTGKDYKPNKADWLEGAWDGFERAARGEGNKPVTGIAESKLKEIGLKLSSIPENFAPNPKIVTQMAAKRKMFETGEGIDWATAEALAFGSLLTEGFPVRLSGQDCGRGTFSHRHSVLVDQNDEHTHVPLNSLGTEKKYEVIDSLLSEFAVLGYEYGYSLADPKALTLWEAQFGDFSNGAQVIMDQFISSGEAKWLRMSGLVMLLPHGYEGQGPEHSSARLERYLQLCGENNMQVANCTTAANYFHILRRQLHRPFRKPLVLMTPKSLLRKKEVFANIKDLAENTTFSPVIGETEKLVADSKIRKVVVCSGKVYYDVVEKRAALGINDVAVIRLEQFYPFPAEDMAAEFGRYKNAEFVWLQEEPKNMGGWLFVRAFLDETLESHGFKKRVTYVGRIAAASPATGFYKIHNKEQDDICVHALS